jgi:hypothetical protein
LTLEGHELRTRVFLMLAAGALLAGCRAPHYPQPSIGFTRVPQADEGGRDKHDIIEGRATGGRHEDQIVLYARSGKWWLQPLVSRPFTKIQPDSKWTSATWRPLATEPPPVPLTATIWDKF